MAFAALALILCGTLLLWLGRRAWRATGLPAGKVVLQDGTPGVRPDQPLYDPVLDLAGWPDYLIEHRSRLIPVEIKSGRAQAGPRRAHVLQLAAYCRVVEAVYARRPPNGRLQYADRSFTIPYSTELEAELESVLAAMRRRLHVELDRSHASPARCRACGFRGVCDQALA